MFKHKIYLASQSPRRQQLLQNLNLINFETVSQNVEETYPPELPLTEVPAFLAQKKAQAAEHFINNETDIVLSADTIVLLDNKIYGKPINYNDAVNMLTQLSGKNHTVITGICLLSKSKIDTFSVHTQVHFYPITLSEIEYYVTNYKPYDKAGAYAIQEWIGLVAIEKIDGCYFNVMGLPISKLCQVLKNF